MYDDNVFQQMLPLIIFLIVLYGALILGGLASYILHGLAVMRLSTTLGLRNGWLGFVPIGMDFQLGKMAGEIELGSKKVKNPGLWLALIPVAVNILFSVGYFALIFSTTFQAAIEGSYSSSYYDSEEMILSFLAKLFIGFFSALYCCIRGLRCINLDSINGSQQSF